MHEVQRKRTLLGSSEDACAICGRPGLDLIESRRVRRGKDLLNPGFDPAVRTYRRCRSCNARHDLEGGAVPRPRNGED